MRNKQVMVKTLLPSVDPSLIALRPKVVAIPSMQSKDAPCDASHGHHHKQTAIALATRIFCFATEGRRKKYFLND